MKYSTAKNEEINQQLISYMHDNIDKNDQLTIKKVSEALYYSEATIHRASRKMGYLGFTQMKFDLLRQHGTSDLSNNIKVMEDVNFKSELYFDFISRLRQTRCVVIISNEKNYSGFIRHILIGKNINVIELEDPKLLNNISHGLVLGLDNYDNAEIQFSLSSIGGENNFFEFYGTINEQDHLSIIIKFMSYLNQEPILEDKNKN